jgi:hypothetical protein
MCSIENGPRGPEHVRGVNHMAEKKISPKAASSKGAKSTTKAAATRVTKRKALKKSMKKT